MSAEPTLCRNCRELLGDSAFCTSCGTPTGTQPSNQMHGFGCGTCGVQLTPGTAFCTNCGTAVAAVPASASPGPAVSSPARSSSTWWLVVGMIVVVALLGTVALVAARSADRNALGPAEDSTELRSGSNGGVSGNDDGASDIETSDETEPVDEETTSVPPESTTTTSLSTTTPASQFFAERDVVYGRYVAVLWSGFITATGSGTADRSVESELAKYQAQFGANVIAIDSNFFRSLRDGTVAVVYDGGFSSARDAKRWCRANGFPGTQDCFGVVLSDDHTPDQRGEFVRVYDV